MSTITVTIDINGDLHTRHSIRQPGMDREQAETIGDRVTKAVADALRDEKPTYREATR